MVDKGSGEKGSRVNRRGIGIPGGNAERLRCSIRKPSLARYLRSLLKELGQLHQVDIYCRFTAGKRPSKCKGSEVALCVECSRNEMRLTWLELSKKGNWKAMNSELVMRPSPTDSPPQALMGTGILQGCCWSVDLDECIQSGVWGFAFLTSSRSTDHAPGPTGPCSLLQIKRLAVVLTEMGNHGSVEQPRPLSLWLLRWWRVCSGALAGLANSVWASVLVALLAPCLSFLQLLN